MSDMYPAHGDERCMCCHDDITLWYATVPDPPAELVVCVPCYLLLTTGEAV